MPSAARGNKPKRGLCQPDEGTEKKDSCLEILSLSDCLSPADAGTRDRVILPRQLKSLHRLTFKLPRARGSSEDLCRLTGRRETYRYGPAQVQPQRMPPEER